MDKSGFCKPRVNTSNVMLSLLKFQLLNPLYFCFLFDLILYIHSTIFQLCGTGLPGLNQY